MTPITRTIVQSLREAAASPANQEDKDSFAGGVAFRRFVGEE